MSHRWDMLVAYKSDNRMAHPEGHNVIRGCERRRLGPNRWFTVKSITSERLDVRGPYFSGTSWKSTRTFPEGRPHSLPVQKFLKIPKPKKFVLPISFDPHCFELNYKNASVQLVDHSTPAQLAQWKNICARRCGYGAGTIYTGDREC